MTQAKPSTPRWVLALFFVVAAVGSGLSAIDAYQSRVSAQRARALRAQRLATPVPVDCESLPHIELGQRVTVSGTSTPAGIRCVVGDAFIPVTYRQPPTQPLPTIIVVSGEWAAYGITDAVVVP